MGRKDGAFIGEQLQSLRAVALVDLWISDDGSIDGTTAIKKRCSVLSRPGSTLPVAASWRSWQVSLDPRCLVFIDETWSRPTWGPASRLGQRGQRLCGFAHGPLANPDLRGRVALQ
nr:hypothetical protein [Mesorhizobium sp. B2-5-9]